MWKAKVEHLAICLLLGITMAHIPVLVCPSSPILDLLSYYPAFLVYKKEEFLNRRSFCSSNTQLCGVPCLHTSGGFILPGLCTCCSCSLRHLSPPSSADQLLLIRQDSAQAVASSREYLPFLAWMRSSCWELLPARHVLPCITGGQALVHAAL